MNLLVTVARPYPPRGSGRSGRRLRLAGASPIAGITPASRAVPNAEPSRPHKFTEAAFWQVCLGAEYHTHQPRTMLRSTFQHLRGIGPRREIEFWRRGVTSWDAFSSQLEPQLSLFGQSDLLAQSRLALESGDADFFAKRLPKREHYRIALSYPHQTLFLDIESTGLSLYYDQITLVGWSFGRDYSAYVRGSDKRPLVRALSHAKVIVTFNGALFDLPFLRKEFPQAAIPTAHVDLRYMARRAGLRGTQKEIEEAIGVSRDPGVASLRGEHAPVLWHYYTRGDLPALRRLIRYNHADIEGMKFLFDHFAPRILQASGAPASIRSFHRFTDGGSRLVWGPRKTKHRGVIVRRYRGRVGPRVRFRDLASQELDLNRLSIVGIDLTGSEARPTGWCHLAGRRATTNLVSSDEEIVKLTLKAQPRLVSIDSPLSLPAGRDHVFDDDPARESAGITRWCERELKRRGVNVYPCLIQSMQKLTRRGIALAEEFRHHGLPTIESYPGAAQDILGIPRKRASLDLLEQGLTEFGITVHGSTRELTHDELDAITSAVVGIFFWSGRFEALGTAQEDYLIIPDLAIDPASCRPKEVIGLCGPIAAGKTTAAEFLRERGFTYTRFSLVLANLLKERGILPTRAALQQYGEQIHRTPGQRWLCQHLNDTIVGAERVVVDGLRHPEDCAFVVERFGARAKILFLDAPTELRRRRYERISDTSSDFDTASNHPVESHVDLLRRLAHSCICNSSSFDSLEQDLMEFIA